jgi:translation initiation factor IF-2
LAKKRIYEIAKELGVPSKDLIAKLDEMGLPGLKAANSVEEDEYTLILNVYQEEAGATKKETPARAEAASEEAPDAGHPTPSSAAGRRRHPSHGKPRPPIVSVLGHIDHGKTTLLDAIRKSHLVGKEAGGITQGIAAYQAELGGRRITFIDTPGHKAFTGMRARGAQVTDIAILVVAADDSIMAQTVEAIDHIHAAGIPMIVAINKIDRPNADVSKVMNDLAKRGLTPEAWGGDTITVEISALQGQNIEELLEMILLVAEMEDLRADPDGPLEAVIIESHLSSGRGAVASAVVRDGTLRVKDWIVAGSTYGRIRALLDETGSRVGEVPPGMAAEILGFGDVPEVGSVIRVAKDQTEARKVVQERLREEKGQQAVQRPKSFEDFFAQAEETAKLRLVLKAGSTGALEAARREIEGLDVGDVELEILHAGVGAISESDILLASPVADECLIVGFGVKADPKAAKVADRENVAIFAYEVIYDLVEEVESALKRRLAPEFSETQIGLAEVRELFKVPSGVVAGCYVADGRVTRRARARVLRNGKEVHVGEIASLRRFEDDVREVQAGRECGLRIEDFDAIEIGDRLEIFETEEVVR